MEIIGNCINSKCGRYTICIDYTWLCKDCHEAKFQEIKEFLRENGNQDIRTIAREVHVPTKVIEGYIQEGRLQEELKKNNIDMNMCPHCGAPVDHPGLCSKCCQKLNTINELRDRLNGPKQNVPDFPLPDKESHGMRYFRK